MIRVLTKFKQAGVQHEKLDEKLENFTIECCYLSLKLNNYFDPAWCPFKVNIEKGLFIKFYKEGNHLQNES